MKKRSETGEHTGTMALEIAPGAPFARLADGRIIGLSHIIYIEPKGEKAFVHMPGSSVEVDKDTAAALAAALFYAPAHAVAQEIPVAPDPTSEAPVVDVKFPPEETVTSATS